MPPSTSHDSVKGVRFWVRISAFLQIMVAMSMVSIAIIVASFMAAHEVENHIDAKIDSVVRNQTNKESIALFQELVSNVRQIKVIDNSFCQHNPTVCQPTP